MVYRIRNWSQHFENNRTRELKEMRFVIIPNKHDGDGYTELLDHSNGAAHYGAWVAIVQVASKCDPRGTLLRDGNRAHDFASLSRLTRLPEKVFREAIPRLVEIGWIEELPQENEQDSTISQETAVPIAAESRTPLRKSDTEWNGMEGNRKERNTSASLVSEVFNFWKDQMGKPKAQLTPDRKKKIEERLGDSTVEEIKCAISGCRASDFHMGRQPGNPQVFNDIELICRKRSKLESFIAMNPVSVERPKPRIESVEQRLARESCLRCHGTGTEIIVGKGARQCSHGINQSNTPRVESVSAVN